VRRITFVYETSDAGDLTLLAIGLCLALFVFWGAVGYAATSVLMAGAGEHRLRALLIGPAVGVILTVIPLFILNRLGVPVRYMAGAILAVLVLGALVVLIFTRPAIPWKKVAPFGGVLALALILTGRPMFEFGLNWMSYCNDDMANYCLSGRWLKSHSVFDAPSTDEIISGADYSKTYWMLHVPAMSRMGCELLVSWTSTLTGISEHQVFNPLILAFHLALIAALGAVVMRTPEMWLVALFAMGMASLSAMNSLGTLYQVIAQVIGLAVLATNGTVMLRSFDGLTRGQIIRHGILVGITGAGQAILYAEVFPFLFLAFCAYMLASALRREKPWRILPVLGIGILVGLVLIRMYAYTVYTYIVLQSAGGSLGDDPLKVLMPYFLVPAGLANLWGFQHITNLGYEPWLSLTILAGALLLIAAAVAAVWATWKGHAVAAFAVGMIALGPYLFMHRTGFGLFKLAMFVQPFMLGTIAVAWFALMRNKWARVVPVVLLGLSSVYVQQWYVDESRGTTGTFSLVPFATPSKVDAEFMRVAEACRGKRLVGDAYNVVLAKFQSLHTAGTSTLILPSNDFYRPVMTYKENLSVAGAANLKHAKDIMNAQDTVFTDAVFKLNDPALPDAINKFHTCKVGGYADESTEAANPDTLLLVSGGIQGIYNRRHYPPPPTFKRVKEWTNFNVVPYSQAHNHLISIASDLSQPFYSADPARIGAYQIEREPFYFRGSTMAGLGRYLMFQVVRPTEGVRLVVNVTASYNADGSNALPPTASAIGQDKRWSLGAVGCGSARLFSPPLVPQRIDGRDYFMIDFGRPGQRFNMPRKGLMSLYGRDVAIDRRLLVGFARDVSAISDEEYQKLTPPGQLTHFPDDLANPNLEYSGIYEDGWVSEASFATLAIPATTEPSATPAVKAIAVKGSVPNIGGNSSFTTDVTLKVDGVEVAKRTLTAGEFEVRGALPAKTADGSAPAESHRRVELLFTNTQHLPEGDNRPVAALLKFVGFVDASPAERGLAKGK
jgi:hypothetical protein